MDLSEKVLWQAVLKRDRRYNGICFYGVMSTFWSYVNLYLLPFSLSEQKAFT